MAAIKVPVGPFAIGTLLGLAPRTAAVVFVGAGLSQLDFSNRQQTGMFAAGAVVTVARRGRARAGWPTAPSGVSKRRPETARAAPRSESAD